MAENKKIAGVPTNIITGFLGTGKTSTILNLLETKPSAERWAVLVNEFGEIGVDGSLMKGNHSEEEGVFIREVPGGCMCCTAGLPMQVALAVLLKQARPDRLLIEPTGLGHPVEVLGVLSGGHNQETLSIQKVVTLVDARHLTDRRYTEHETFNQQIAIADVVVGNKSDLYGNDDRDRLKAYVEKQGAPRAEVLFTEYGNLDPALLVGATQASADAPRHHHHHHENGEPELSEKPLPESGFLKAENKGEGFQSVGWRFSPTWEFERSRLFSFFSGLDSERMKGVFITGDGVFGYNMAGGVLSELPLDDCLESRVEIIAAEIDSAWEQQLMDCRSPS
jgi:G3E family GTPase